MAAKGPRVLLEQPSHRTAKLMTQIHSSVPYFPSVHSSTKRYLAQTVYATEIVTCNITALYSRELYDKKVKSLPLQATNKSLWIPKPSKMEALCRASALGKACMFHAHEYKLVFFSLEPDFLLLLQYHPEGWITFICNGANGFMQVE